LFWALPALTMGRRVIAGMPDLHETPALAENPA
jgi:hypothetical protein